MPLCSEQKLQGGIFRTHRVGWVIFVAKEIKKVNAYEFQRNELQGWCEQPQG